MKNIELVQLWNFVNSSFVVGDDKIAVKQVMSEIPSTRLHYWKKRNLEKLTSMIKSLQEDQQAMKSPAIISLEKSKRDEKAEEAYRIAIDSLINSKEYKELMDIETEFEVKKITIDDLPADLSAMQMEAISWMVE